MRISLVSEHASPLAVLGGRDAGGQNVHVAELAAALARRGCDVTVHTRRDDPDLPDIVEFCRGVLVDHVDAGPAEPLPKDDLLPWMPAFAEQLATRWTAWPPDAVHSHFWMSGLATLDAIDHLTERVPAVHTYHALGAEKRVQQGTDDTSPRERLAIEADIAVRMDGIVATTRAERATLIDMGADPERVTVVPCGVDLGRFRPAATPENAPAAVRRRPHRIVAASRLVPRKGLDDLIIATAALPDAELVVAGGPVDTPVEDDPEGGRLLDLARGLGIDDRVALLGGVDRDAIPGLLAAADVVVCSPWYEPFGMVALEAMASGVPVVATAVGGLAETVVHDRTGILVPPRDPEALSRALELVLHEPDRRARLGAASIERAWSYDWNRIAVNILGFLRRLPEPQTTATLRPGP